MALTFEWDARKAAANLAKHGVSFDEGSQSLPIRSVVSRRTTGIQFLSLVSYY